MTIYDCNLPQLFKFSAPRGGLAVSSFHYKLQS